MTYTNVTVTTTAPTSTSTVATSWGDCYVATTKAKYYFINASANYELCIYCGTVGSNHYYKKQSVKLRHGDVIVAGSTIYTVSITETITVN